MAVHKSSKFIAVNRQNGKLSVAMVFFSLSKFNAQKVAAADKEMKKHPQVQITMSGRLLRAKSSLLHL